MSRPSGPVGEWQLEDSTGVTVGAKKTVAKQQRTAKPMPKPTTAKPKPTQPKAPAPSRQNADAAPSAVPVMNPQAFCKRESVAARRDRTAQIYRQLCEAYPDAECELHHQNPFELLIATILSAQTTDARVNSVTPALFSRYPDAKALADAEVGEVETMLRTIGFFRAKAAAIIKCAQALVQHHAGRVPATMEALTELAGVGRKTANVVLGVAFGINVGIPVDTHVNRLSQRLALSAHADPKRIESDLQKLVPKPDWRDFSLRLILHGRRVCAARAPKCSACSLAPFCPSRRI